MTRTLAWLRGDEPTHTGWTADSGLTYTPGSGTPPDARLQGSGVGGEVAALRRRLTPTDVQERRRGRDRMTVQAYLEVATNSAVSWPASAGIQLDDGRRSIALLVDTTVRLYAPSGAAGTLAVVRTGHSPSLRHHYRLEKDGSSWLVYIDEDLAARVPYELAAESVGGRARAAVGLLDPGGAGDVRMGEAEATLNLRLPMPSDVIRAQRGMLLMMQQSASVTVLAMTRTIAGLAREVVDLMTDLWQDLDGGGVEVEHLVARHDRMPTDQALPWTQSGAGTLVLERERWRTTGAVNLLRSLAALEAPATASAWLRATWARVTDSVGVSDDLGAQMQVAYGGASVYALSYQDPTTGADYWVLADAANPALANALSQPFELPTRQAHTVELVLVPAVEALLKVGGQVVGRAQWADLPPSAVAQMVLLSDGTNDWLIERVQSRVAGFPLGHRPAFRQRLAERLIPTTGCERNDTLDRWSRDRWAMHEARGTEIGIHQEIARMTCGEGSYTSAPFDGTWHVDKTFPDVSPVVCDPLASPNLLIPSYVEWPHPVSGLAEAELAKVVCKYLLPISTLERVYWFTVAHPLTAPSSVVGGDVRLTVADTSPFEVGQLVQLRNTAGFAVEATFVSNVVSATQIDVSPTIRTWSTGDVLRRLVRRT